MQIKKQFLIETLMHGSFQEEIEAKTLKIERIPEILDDGGCQSLEIITLEVKLKRSVCEKF